MEGVTPSLPLDHLRALQALALPAVVRITPRRYRQAYRRKTPLDRDRLRKKAKEKAI